MAKCQRLDESSVADIHHQYEDNIYTEGHYDVQIVKTIGWAQPSYVIPENNICTLMATPL
jgi:vacuolar protein sorting-associated protein 11